MSDHNISPELGLRLLDALLNDDLEQLVESLAEYLTERDLTLSSCYLEVLRDPSNRLSTTLN